MELLKKISFWLLMILSVSMFPLWLIPCLTLLILTSDYGYRLSENNILAFSEVSDNGGWVGGLIIFSIGNMMNGFLAAGLYELCIRILGFISTVSVTEKIQGGLLLTQLDMVPRFLTLLGFWFLIYKAVKPFVIQFIYRFVVLSHDLDQTIKTFVFTRKVENYTDDLNTVDSLAHLFGILVVLQIIVLALFSVVIRDHYVLLMYVQSPMLIFIVLFSISLVVLFFVLIGAIIHKIIDTLPKSSAGGERSLKKSLFKLFF